MAVEEAAGDGCPKRSESLLLRRLAGCRARKAKPRRQDLTGLLPSDVCAFLETHGPLEQFSQDGEPWIGSLYGTMAGAFASWAAPTSGIFGVMPLAADSGRTTSATPEPGEPLALEELAAFADDATRGRHARIRAVQREIWRLSGIELSSNRARQIDPDRLEMPRRLWRRLEAVAAPVDINGPCSGPVYESRFCGFPVDIIEG